ncbi:MAG: DUF4190 domain-containing protein [Demequina sp.]
MSTRDPFETPASPQHVWQPDGADINPKTWAGAGEAESVPPAVGAPSDGYAHPGYTAPGYAPPQGAAPGFVGHAPDSPPPSYGYADGGSAPEGPSGTDGPSIAALVTGFLGLGVVAVVLGAIGLRRTAGGQRKGTWLAVTGIVLGVVGTIVATAVITWSITAASELFEDGAWTDGDGNVIFDDSSYGDDPFLDALWEACDSGDDTACDELFLEAPFGSGYADFGDSCGQRGRPLLQTWCEEGRTW